MRREIGRPDVHAVHCQGPHNPSPRNGTVLRGQRSSGDAGLPRQGFHLGHSHLFSVPSISIISLSIFSCSTTLSFYRGGKEGGHSVCMAFVPSWKRQNFGTVHSPSQFWVIHLFDRQKGGKFQRQQLDTKLPSCASIPSGMSPSTREPTTGHVRQGPCAAEGSLPRGSGVRHTHDRIDWCMRIKVLLQSSVTFGTINSISLFTQTSDMLPRGRLFTQ